MPRIVRTPRARDDLIEIWSYIALDNPTAADAMLDLIEEKIGMLAENPRLGPARPDIAEAVRLFPVNATAFSTASFPTASRSSVWSRACAASRT